MEPFDKHIIHRLVRCGKGAVLDVAVDIRRGRLTYGKYVECLLCACEEEGERIAKEYNDSITDNRLPLTAKTGLQFFVPCGFAHGFAVISKTAVFQYKCDEFYHPESDSGIAWGDPDIGL